MPKPTRQDRRPRPRHDRPKSREDGPRPRRTDALRVAGLAAVSALFQQAPERVERLFFLPDMGRAVGRYCQALGRAH